MTFQPDLDAYFQRLGLEASPEVSLPALQRLIAAHVRAIPFENLDILLGRGISLDPRALQEKLVHGQRGGYCFEQNGLLLQVLTELGYSVQPLSARVHGDQPRSFIPNRTHLFLRVELEGESWLADVGVGSGTPPQALRLELDRVQPTALEARRIVAVGDWSGFQSRSPEATLYHQIQYGERWEDVCDFTLEPMHANDREQANWFTSTHPSSKFRQRLSAARVTAKGRVTLNNAEFKVRDASGQAEGRLLRSAGELLDCLGSEFGLKLPAGTRFDCVDFD